MKRALIAFLLIAVVLVAGIFAIVVIRPPFALPLLQLAGIAEVENGQSSSAAAGSAPDAEAFSNVDDALLSEGEQARAQAERDARERTLLVAQIDDVDLRCPIVTSDLTGVLFHQASYSYALVLSTKLPEADYEKTANKHEIRVNKKQNSGEWLDADALHVWRTGDVTPMDTSIDIGALPGTVVRSPVTGTVVLVKDYKLYDQIDDIEIHIQPEGRPDLDCVLIHTVDPLVKAGDSVEAGLTEISHVRDIEKDLIDVQLSYFTPEGVGGNHTHVQINDATAKDYRKEKLKGALKVS